MTEDLRRKLARRLAARRKLDVPGQETAPGATPASGQTIPLVPEGSVVPLSHAQERMWFLHQLDPAASAYNVCVLWHLCGVLDAEALARSVDRLIERHSILRTLYSTDEDGQGRQQVLAHLPAQWSREDLRALDPQTRTDKLQEIAQRAGTAPFDLASRSALRLVLVALTDTHHVLVMVGQHVVWDGPSFSIFSRELAEAYNLFRAGQPDLRPRVPAQYIDFAHWHRRRWQGPSAHRSSELAFWETRLDPLPEPLNFPVDFDRGAGNDEAGAWCTESLDATVTAALTELAARERVTPFVVLISAIAVLMTRLARASEVTIGTVASHRSLPELQGVIGNFGNVVPLRVAVSGGWSFRELLRRCAACCQSSFAHADIPFECLLEHFQIARGEGSSPLLDTMVTFLSRDMEPPAMDGLSVHWEKHFNGTSQIDLSFDALLIHGTLQLQATWRRSLYRRETVRNCLRRLANLLRECVANPDAPLAQRCLLLPDERVQLTEHWGMRPALPVEAETLVAWFERTAGMQPNDVAVCGPGSRETGGASSLSFAALNARANRLARWLAACGIGPEDRVALGLPRRSEWFVAMLAILKAGASFVPIDPSYPRQYVERVLQQAQPVLGFVDRGRTGSALSQETDTLVDLTDAEEAARQAGLSALDLSDSERRRPLRSAHPVCVVFTSGSSGEPKGVVVSHAALVNLLSSHRRDLYEEACRVTGRRHLRVGHAWSLAFDASWQPTLWMFEGHEVHLFDTDVMRDPIELARQVILRRLDFIELTPGMLEEVLPWLQSGLTEADGVHLPGHVPAILGFGGEAVKQALWERILKLQGTAGFNLYGPTEATVDAMIARVEANQPANIGRPVAGAQVYVLDHCLQLAPPGVPGELAIGGKGLARGYLSRGDLTASRFIANPFGAPGSRLYRTGDRVRWLPHGGVEYLGRIDEQIKIRGFRVEPLEVEANLEKLARRSCAVVARAARGGEMQLLCFVESDTDEEMLDPEPLRRRCAASLPSHLVPKHFIAIERMPRLPNGKINRQALRMPEELDARPGRGPRTAIEVELCTLFAEVLGKENVGIDDGFFESGGDSISVIKLVSQARRKGLALTARQVFSARTVAGLASQWASIAEDASNIDDAAVAHDIEDTGRATPTPLMMRYLSLGHPLQRFAQIVSMPLPPGMSDAELECLLDALIERHALLRAQLVRSEEGALRLEVPDKPVSNTSVRTYRLRSTDNDKSKRDAAELARDLCEQLDPLRGRMLAAARVTGLGEGDEDQLCLAINHLVVDAGSWHILAGDLALGRAAQERGEPVELPPVPTAWRTWSAARHGRAGAAVPCSARGTLASACRMSWVLNPAPEECLAAVAARRLGLPLASLLPALTALAALHAGLVPEQSNGVVCLVVERHGREPSAPGQDLSRTVGWFARELRLRLQARGDSRDGAKDNLIAQLRQWCGAIIQLDGPSEPLPDEQRDVSLPAGGSDWQLGFNFLGELIDPRQCEAWAPKPRLDWLVEACGDHWPLLHELDVSAYYDVVDGRRLLRFDAMSSLESVDHAALKRLFDALQTLLNDVAGEAPLEGGGRADARISERRRTREVTPLQYEMLRHCRGDTDPWTTQMELCLVATPEQSLTAAALRQSAVQLLSRHDALRTGFARDGVSTFVARDLEPEWETLDWRSESPERQDALLNALRRRCYQTPFRLDEPPLLRFAAVQLSDGRWRVLMNSHHLLLDGWSVPRTLRDWLGGACGLALGDSPPLSWMDYLDWLQSQDRGASIRYWNRALRGLPSPSLLRPGRAQRYPSSHAYDALSLSQSQALIQAAKEAGVSDSAFYQLAWARTLSQELGQSDVVFGLFDSGRAASASMEGLEALVGLVTQLVPVRINGGESSSDLKQLNDLQAGQFEWQGLAPVRLDNLEAHSQGEFFDTLLVVENALDADREIATTHAAPFSVLQGQSWQDSVGQVAGLFVYPGSPVELRLCHDPSAIDANAARRLLGIYKQQLCRLAISLGADPAVMRDMAPELPRRLSPIPTATDLG